MIKQLESPGPGILGFSADGDITKDDYAILTPAVEKAVAEHGSVRLLIDLRGFRWEKVSAWGDDLGFGKQLHGKTERMAIVGQHTWQKYLTRLAQPFYANEARYFEKMDPAWAWLES